MQRHALTPLWRFLLLRCCVWETWGRVSEPGLGKPTRWFRVEVSGMIYFLCSKAEGTQVFHIGEGRASVSGFLHGAQGSLPTHPSLHLTTRGLPCWQISSQARETACPHGFSTMVTSPSIQVQLDLHSEASTSLQTPSSLLVSPTTFLWFRRTNLKFRSCLKYEEGSGSSLHLPSLVPDTVAMVWGYRLVPAPSKFKLISIFDLLVAFSCRLQGRWAEKNDFIIFSQKSVFI